MLETTETPETPRPPRTTDGGRDRPPVVTFLNQKGGVGKTSLVIHTAGALAARGHRVLVVDLAPEGDLTTILGHADHYDPARDETLHAALTAPREGRSLLEDLVVSREEFDLVPSNEQLLGLDTAAALEDQADGRLALDQLLGADVVREYDVVLVDNEPRINALTDAAIVAADGVVVPLYAEALSVQGLSRLGKQIESVAGLGAPTEILAFVLNRVETNNQAEAIVSQVWDGFGDGYSIFEIRKRVDLQRSLSRDSASVFASSVECDQEAVLEDLAERIEEGVGLEVTV